MTAVAEAFATAGETPWDSSIPLFSLLVVATAADVIGYCCYRLIAEVTIVTVILQCKIGTMVKYLWALSFSDPMSKGLEPLEEE